MLHTKAFWATLQITGILAGSPATAFAQKIYDAGASDTEIKIGNIGPYSGPASAYAAISKTFVAYFKMLNEKGGINGRKVTILSYDDAYSPPKTVEQARKLVESDEVLAIAGVVGTPGNSAIQRYMHQRGVPHLFFGSGASKWADPKNFPWSMAWLPSYRDEARIYARYILKNYPGKKVGILFQNDDFGKDYLVGFNEVFGSAKSQIVTAEVPFDVSQPSIDPQIVQIKTSNPDVFVNIATPKFAAQAIKKIGDLGWRPVHFITNVSVSVSAVLKPAGLENSQGIMSAAYLKDPNDPQWKDDAGMNEFRAFMSNFFPEGDAADALTVSGYSIAETLLQVLKQCGDDLTRKNVMRQAANLDMVSGVALPGIRFKTSPTDYSPIEQMQLMRFQGDSWHLFGQLTSVGAENN
ncbi:ABC transporter substrate-binding protein [Bradyrhizobium sp. 190]|uniref:ABC transporter substrate-binding protein n=1 Tax=Bradyrhizobium sp. 190 TaxID=2782658 RepID=UPI001FF837B9|nr:ABC transporter substrate-binding protein [Bradyrhizobium sp. 190]MCK1512981.1 ABC transporter substrate-binding protein [Bradyrhizobium sp. 190]